MASCNNPGATMLFGHSMPDIFSSLQSYKNEITKGLSNVNVTVRTKPNGSGVKRSIRIQQKLAGNITSVFEEIFSNTSVAINDMCCFSFRPINNPSKPGSKQASIHSLGMAIDINPSVNGFIAPDGKPNSAYVMRNTSHPIVKAFLKHGWSWGGTWNSSKKDYMHFEFIKGDSSFLNGNYVSNNIDMSSGGTTDGSSFSSGGSNSSGGGFSNSALYANNGGYSFKISPNTVYTLASNGEKNDVLKIDENRKNDFEALRTSLITDMIQSGRDVIKSPELYNSSILKSGQSAKIIRT